MDGNIEVQEPSGATHRLGQNLEITVSSLELGERKTLGAVRADEQKVVVVAPISVDLVLLLYGAIRSVRDLRALTKSRPGEISTVP